jgi:prevent-host-death family protein
MDDITIGTRPRLDRAPTRLTRDTFVDMAEVTIRDLRNHGGEVVDRVLSGEAIVITRSGTPVAELVPLPPEGLNAATLLARWRTLPMIDADALRADLDRVLDPAL